MFYIIKKGTRYFTHRYNNNTKEVNLSEWKIVLDLIAQTVCLELLNGANIPKNAVSVLEVIVIDETGANVEETFTDVRVLRARLVALAYNPYLTGGTGTTPSLYEVLQVGDRDIVIDNQPDYNDYVFEVQDKGRHIVKKGNGDFFLKFGRFPVGTVLSFELPFDFVSSSTGISNEANIYINGFSDTTSAYISIGQQGILRLTEIADGNEYWTYSALSASSGGGSSKTPVNIFEPSYNGTSVTVPSGFTLTRIWSPQDPSGIYSGVVTGTSLAITGGTTGDSFLIDGYTT